MGVSYSRARPRSQSTNQGSSLALAATRFNQTQFGSPWSHLWWELELWQLEPGSDVADLTNG